MASDKNEELPYRILKLATDLFARDTGFSGPEIHDLFASYTDALGPYKGWGGAALHAGNSSRME